MEEQGRLHASCRERDLRELQGWRWRGAIVQAAGEGKGSTRAVGKGRAALEVQGMGAVARELHGMGGSRAAGEGIWPHASCRQRDEWRASWEEERRRVFSSAHGGEVPPGKEAGGGMWAATGEKLGCGCGASADEGIGRAHV